MSTPENPRPAFGSATGYVLAVARIVVSACAILTACLGNACLVVTSGEVAKALPWCIMNSIFIGFGLSTALKAMKSHNHGLSDKCRITNAGTQKPTGGQDARAPGEEVK